MIEIKRAHKEQSAEIARLIMIAMTDECCLYFCGEGYGLTDFHKMMTSLVERTDSQYSYKNALVAMDNDKLVGVAVSYDGALLHELRQVFIEVASEQIGKDHSLIDDETQAGELYLDSLAVIPEYRRQGIAQRLLKATKEKKDAEAQVSKVCSMIDKLAKTNVIHKNKASNLKSSCMRYVNSLA